MTADRPPEPIDDDAIARLVRDAAGAWTMPPVRLDGGSWRDRVRSPRTRRIAALRTGLERLAQAAAAAVALTVGAALLGVWLTTPRDAGKPSATPGHSPNSRPSQVAASPLPKLFLAGDLPQPSQLTVQADSSYSLVDLRSGTISNPFAIGDWGSALRTAADGVPYCVCLRNDGFTSAGTTHVSVALVRSGSSGPASTSIGDIRGVVDPRGAAPADGQPAGARVTFGTDPRYAYVGWAAREHPVWKAGIIVVDVETGSIVQRVALPDRSDGESDSRTAVVAPGVVGLAGDGQLLVVAPWYRWSPAMSQNPTMHFGSDVFATTLDAGALGGLAPFDAGAQCGDQVMRAGALPDGGTWLACLGAGGGQTIVRRIAGNGSVNETRVAGGGDLGSDSLGTSTISPDGRALYAWDPIGGTLTAVDLATGKVTSGLASTAAGPGPLTALGRWLTPTATAKVFLSSGIAVSPDGTRVYVLGLEPGAASSHDLAGSTGVFVFDAATLAQVGHWAPTADFVSLAVSTDGRFVYAAGSPGTTSGGTAGAAAASVTVFEASTGTVRLIAGQLGHALLLFPATTVP
jgi:hypothetical protein